MVNVIISTYQADDMGELIVSAETGSVGFGSGKDTWAFTITKFSRLYAQKFKTDANKLQSKLWGDNYFDAEAKCWR
jgi:elongation factor 2